MTNEDAVINEMIQSVFADTKSGEPPSTEEVVRRLVFVMRRMRHQGFESGEAYMANVLCGTIDTVIHPDSNKTNRLMKTLVHRIKQDHLNPTRLESFLAEFSQEHRLPKRVRHAT